MVLSSTQWSTAKRCAGFTTMHIQLHIRCTFLLFNHTFSLPLTIILFFIKRPVARGKNNKLECFSKVTTEKTDKSNDTNITKKKQLFPSFTPRLLLLLLLYFNAKWLTMTTLLKLLCYTITELRDRRHA